MAIPRLLKTSRGRLPAGVLMPMMAGIGASGAPSGRLIVAVISKMLSPSPTVIVIVLPLSAALNVLGLPGFSQTS